MWSGVYWVQLRTTFTCPQRWTGLMRNFQSSQAIGQLGLPDGFHQLHRGLLPVALCGRSSLYSLRQASQVGAADRVDARPQA